MRLPSIKIVFIAIACLIVVGGFYFYFSKNKAQTYESSAVVATPQAIVAQSVKSSATTDTDSDGLMDWEEILWNTDPLSPDTNKDGVPDAQEVEKKKAKELADAQKAAKAEQTKTEKPQVQTPPKNLTLTDQLARDAFVEYVNLKQTGGTLTEADADRIAQDILQKNNFERNIPQFSLPNLKNIGGDSETEIHDYGNAFWDIMVNNTPKNMKLTNEYVTFLIAVQQQSENEMKKIDPIITGYEKTLKDLLAMEIPRGAAEKHLAVLNSLNALLATIQDMRTYFTDSARGLSGLINYNERTLSVRNSIKALSVYLQEKGGAYVEGEGGYLLVHSI